MKHKISWIVCVVTMVFLCSGITPAATINTTNELYEKMEENIQPRTDIKEWIYAIIDGDLYKRLYNYSTARWETDWIFVAHGEQI